MPKTKKNKGMIEVSGGIYIAEILNKLKLILKYY